MFYVDKNYVIQISSTVIYNNDDMRIITYE